MNKYVLQHNFGYGQNSQVINKLNLRNIEDLKCYITSLIDATFTGKFTGNLLIFEDQNKVKISIGTL